MKAVYVTDIDLADKGAPPIHVREIIENLSRLNNEVLLIAPNGKLKTFVKSISIPSSNLKFLRSIFFNFILIFVLLFLIFKNRLNIIYTRQSGFLVVPALLSKLFNIPYVTELNGTIEEEMIANKNPKWMVKIATTVEKFCYKNAKKIIATSPVLMKYIIKKYGVKEDKVISLENGVNTTLFFPKNKLKCRRKLKLQKNVFCIGYTGGLQHWQGLDYIIRAIKIVKSKSYKIKFLIVGEGSEKNKLNNLIKKLRLEKEIFLLNSISHSEVPDYINSFDISVCYLTRFKEGKYGSPFKVYEYLSCGKPVILSDIKGVSELFKDKVILAKPENSKDLAKKILYLIKNKNLAKKMGREGRKFVLNGHSWKSVAERTLKVIKGVINSK